MQGDKPQDNVRLNNLRQAQDLAEKGDFESAYDLAYRWLKTEPNDPEALNLIAYIMLNTEKAAIAYPILRTLTQIAPDYSAGWLNMGMACADLWRYNEAIRAYKKGIKWAQNDAEVSSQCVNIASTMVDHGDFEEAEPYCHKAIELRPETVKGRANLGFCQLAQRNWAEGWANYRYCINSQWRPIVQYNDEPLWDGKEKGTICIYSEQGLGDEISFGQMLPDMKRWCDENDSRLIVDVNPRLRALFARSFPDLQIHGTRGQSQISWDPREITHSLPMAQIGEYFRTKDEDFSGAPYLVADPDRVAMWSALFKQKKKPVIGLGWRGGIWKTAARYRQLDLEQLLPVLKSVDAHWVSLQYKPAGKEIEAFKEAHPEIDIVEYPYGTLSQDYDDTVAMIAAMDMVVSMQTTVIHVAGGLGVPCWVFVPRTSQWRYGSKGEDFPWAKSVRIIRQVERGEWADVMEKTGEELNERYSSDRGCYAVSRGLFGDIADS
jgi:tetratricopeptide (TPR) repeat protein